MQPILQVLRRDESMVGRAGRDSGEVTDAEDRGSVAAPFDTAGDQVPGVSGFLNGREDADQVEIAGFVNASRF